MDLTLVHVLQLSFRNPKQLEPRLLLLIEITSSCEHAYKVCSSSRKQTEGLRVVIPFTRMGYLDGLAHLNSSNIVETTDTYLLDSTPHPWPPPQ